MAASLQDIFVILQEIKADLPAIIANTQISPNQVVIVKGLSELSDTIGLMMAGEFRAGNAKEPGFGFTGVRMGYPPFSYASLLWNIVGVSNDVLQFGLNAADGKAYFGGGVNIIDQYGVHVYDTGGEPAFIALSAAETVNSESLGAGDVLLGDNSSTKPNLLWDQSAGTFYFRLGTVNVGVMSSSGMLGGVGARLYRETNFSAQDNVLDPVEWEGADYDDNGYFNISSPTKLTIPTGGAGRYRVGACTIFESTASGTLSHQIRLNLSGGSGPILAITSAQRGATNVVNVDLEDGDYIEVYVLHTSGSDKNIIFHDNHANPTFWIERVR